MGIKFSEDQTKIINSRNENLLVSAAAGSGKTAVLVERIIKRVTDPVNPIDIDRILVVTFTNAAAKEMKERIAKALNEALIKDPLNKHLARQKELVHNALITTIDSFCLYLVRNHFHTIGLDPSVRVADALEMEYVKEDILKKIIKEAYESNDRDFYRLVDCYSGKKDDDKITDSISSLYKFSMSYPLPVKWLRDRMKDYDILEKNPEESALIKDIFSYVLSVVSDIEEDIRRCEEICALPLGPFHYLEAFTADKNFIEGFKETLNKGKYEDIRLYIAGFEKFKVTKRPKVDADLRDQVKNIRDAYIKNLEEIRDKVLYLPSDKLSLEMAETGIVVKKLIELTLLFIDRFTEEKRDMGVIDFTDMEHLAVDILIDDFKDVDSFTVSDVAKEYKEFFEEIMIDEYQDSNLVQEIMLKSISREEGPNPNRFMVGDVKQSIYRFRLARPEIFIGKSETYKSQSSAGTIINLKENYRSRESVVKSVNRVFEKVMTKKNGGIPYDEDAYLYARADYSLKEDDESNITEINLLTKDGKGAEEVRSEEALAIAEKINELVDNFPVFDKNLGAMRKARYGDICILFRNHSKWIPVMQDVFNEYQIPYHAEGNTAFYGSYEIKNIINYLKIINNPLEDIPLYGSMTSFFGKFTDEECAEIKINAGDTEYYLWEKLKKYQELHPDYKKLNDFISKLENYRDRAKYTPVNILIKEIIDDFGYRLFVSSMKNGSQRMANVDLLVDKATNFAKTKFHGVFQFLRYIELLKRVEKEDGEASVFDEAANTVHIMSIHKSKGLEFPICIIGEIDGEIKNKDASNAFVFDIDKGIGANYIDPYKRVKRSTPIRYYISKNIGNAGLYEEIRILYVAMTRAREKLIMFGAVKDENWFDGIQEAKMNSYLAMIEETAKNDCINFKINKIEAPLLSLDNISIDNKGELVRGKIETDIFDEAEALYTDIKNHFDFIYPYEGLGKLYTKTTVSELKMKAMESTEEAVHRMFEKNETDEYIPTFAGGIAKAKGTDRGTAYHKVLELMDFSEKNLDEARVLAKLTDLVNREKFSMEELELVDINKICTFLNSSVSERMIEAEKNNNLFKEAPFVLGINSNEIDESFPKEELILVQGVIDVYFIENNEIVLLDYKTDRVNSGEELLNRYKTQLDYYGKALERLTGLPVKEKILYSFALNEEVSYK